MRQQLAVLAVLVVVGSFSELAQAQPYCARNNQVSTSAENCYWSPGEADEYLYRDILPNQRRRFLAPWGSPVFSFSGNPPVWTHLFWDYRTSPVQPESFIVKWWNAQTAVGTGAGGVNVYEPEPDGHITELPPPDDVYGRKSEGELFADILQRDNSPGPGTLSGSYLTNPACGFINRTDPLGLERAQVNCWHNAAGLTFHSGSRPWSVANLSRWWCPRGMDDVVLGGMCSKEGLKKSPRVC